MWLHLHKWHKGRCNQYICSKHLCTNPHHTQLNKCHQIIDSVMFCRKNSEHLQPRMSGNLYYKRNSLDLHLRIGHLGIQMCIKFLLAPNLDDIQCMLLVCFHTINSPYYKEGTGILMLSSTHQNNYLYMQLSKHLRKIRIEYIQQVLSHKLYNWSHTLSRQRPHRCSNQLDKNQDIILDPPQRIDQQGNLCSLKIRDHHRFCRRYHTNRRSHCLRTCFQDKTQHIHQKAVSKSSNN